jgi:3-oxoacyl-[acyl-carrier protein] reductase
MNMTATLAGKHAIVTGASKGIGAEIARTLAAQGAIVTVNYSSDRAGAEKVVADIAAAGGRAAAAQADLGAPEGAKTLMTLAVETFGPIDILVNNAGIYEFAPLDQITPDHFHRQFNLNLLGLLLATQEAVRHFRPEGGSIVNISSGVSTILPPNSAVYSATKASVDAVTAVLAKELASRNIRVNAVNPGMIVTEGVRTAGFDHGDMRGWIESVTPMGRVGKVEEIARPVLFLASDASAYVTGETLHVTGGLR